MKRIASLFACLLLSASIAAAFILDHEVTPDNAKDRKWSVSVLDTGETSVFTFFIPFEGGVLPEGTAAGLSVSDGTQLVSRAMLQLQTADDRTFFRFSVGNRFLAHSEFSLTKIHIPHPSGDTYWANLKRFAEARKKESP